MTAETNELGNFFANHDHDSLFKSSGYTFAKHIDKTDGELGLSAPLITTPLNFLSEDDSGGT